MHARQLVLASGLPGHKIASRAEKSVFLPGFLYWMLYILWPYPEAFLCFATHPYAGNLDLGGGGGGVKPREGCSIDH